MRDPPREITWNPPFKKKTVELGTHLLKDTMYCPPLEIMVCGSTYRNYIEPIFLKAMVLGSHIFEVTAYGPPLELMVCGIECTTVYGTRYPPFR